MGKLFRLIDYSVVDFLICDVEDAGHGNDHLHNCAPNSFHYCQFHCSGAGFSEQGSYSFICIKPPYDGQKVVLYSGKRSACNLGCKIPRLTLAESQQALAVLEHDFQRPSLGINPVGFEELQLKVCGDQSVPCALPAASYEEKADLGVRKDDISHGVVAFELAAVPDLLPSLKKFDKCGGSKVIAFKTVFGASLLANLNHTEVVTADMPACGEPYYISAGKPAVSQNVAETHTFPYGAPYHVNGKFDLALTVFVDTFLDGSVFRACLAVSSGKFLCRHTEVAFLAGLAQQGEVKHHLAYAVSDGKRKGLETKDGLVLNMREDTTHKFETLPGLAEISIIDYQAGGAVLVVAADTYPGPQLKGKVVQQLAPVDSGILDETVEHVFSTANHAA